VGFDSSKPWLGAAPGTVVVLVGVVSAPITLTPPFAAPRSPLLELRFAAAAPTSGDEPCKDCASLASADQGLAAVRGSSRPPSAAPPGDALLPAVCALRPSADVGSRRAVALEVFFPLALAAVSPVLPRLGTFAAFLGALARLPAPPSEPLILADLAVAPRGSVSPAAFLRTGADLVPVLADVLPAGLRAPAGAARALPEPLFLAATPMRFVVALEARIPAAFLRAGTLVVLAPVGDLLVTSRESADAERVLPAALFFVADRTRFVVALAVPAPALLVRCLGPVAS